VKPVLARWHRVQDRCGSPNSDVVQQELAEQLDLMDLVGRRGSEPLRVRTQCDRSRLDWAISALGPQAKAIEVAGVLRRARPAGLQAFAVRPLRRSLMIGGETERKPSPWIHPAHGAGRSDRHVLRRIPCAARTLFSVRTDEKSRAADRRLLTITTATRKLYARIDSQVRVRRVSLPSASRRASP